MTDEALDHKIVRRAKDLAAREAVTVYMQAMQRELRAALLERTNGDKPAAEKIPVVIQGVHIHTTVVLDGHGGSLLLKSAWDITTDAEEIARAVGESRAEGQS